MIDIVEEKIAENTLKISPYAMVGMKTTYLPKRIVDITPNDWVESVCKVLEIDFEDLCLVGRMRKMVYGRQLISYILCMNTTLSLNEIAVFFKGAINHHSSIIHNRAYIQGQLDIKNKQVIEDLDKIKTTAKYLGTIKLV